MPPPVPPASLALLQSIFDGASDAIVVVDARGSIVLTNRSAHQLFGYAAEEMAGMAVEALVPTGARVDHAAQRAAFTGSPHAVMGAGRHIMAVRKNGRAVPVDISLSRIDLVEGTFVIAIARDVTVYRRFLDVCPIAIFVLESERVTYANPAAFDLVGVADLTELTRCALADFVHPEDQLAIESWMTLAVETVSETVRPLVEERIVRSDGSLRYVETTSVMVPNTPVPTFLLAMQDVTERRRGWEKARVLENALQQQQRLADIGTVTTRIVHDIANPVAGLIMGTQRALQLIDRMPEAIATPVRPSIDRVLATSRHLETLLWEFKDFSRHQRLDVQSLELGPFLREVVEAWTSEASARDVDLRVDGTPNVSLRGDRLKLRRVFDNLVKNALEAIERGPGTVALTVSTDEPGVVAITVTDSGPGIPPGINPFGLFETTKPNGTGLGLPSVKQIVTDHGGTITLMPGSTSGAVFTVALPLASRLV